MPTDHHNGLFVIDKNFNLIYANKKIRQLYPNLSTGVHCYKSLHNYNSPCSHCPINTKDHNNSIVFNYDKKIWFSSQATDIEVDGVGDCYCITIQPVNNSDNFLSKDFSARSIYESNHDLLENNELWNLALNNMPNGYHRYSAEEGFPFLFISDRFCEIVGYSREEIADLFDNKMVNMWHPDNKINSGEYRYFLGKKSKNKEYNEYIYRIKSKRGYIWVLESTKLVYSKKEKFYQGSITDITSIINCEIKNNVTIDKSENRVSQYKKAILTGANAIYEVNVTDDIMESITLFKDGKEYPLSAFYDIKLPCNYSWYIKNISQYVPEEERGKFIEANNVEALRSHYNNGIYEWQLDYDTLSRQKEFTYLRKTYILTTNNKTKKVHALIVSKDISHKVKLIKERENILKKQKEELTVALSDAEQRLKIIEILSSEYFSVIYANMSDDTFTTYMLPENADDIDIKNKYVERSGFHNKINKLKSMIVSDDRKQVDKMLDTNYILDYLDKNSCYEINCIIKMKNTPEHAQIRIIKTNSKFEQIWAMRSTENIVQEIYNYQVKLQNALEEAKKAEKAKTSFLLNMSHDIRTPMNAIIGFNNIAMKNINNKEKILDSLMKSSIAGKHLLSIINEVLEMSRIDSGIIDINQSIADVNVCFEEIKAIFASSMANKGIKFLTKNEYTVPYVYFDITKVMQIITNLIGNAMKFTKTNGTITYTSKELPDEDKNYVNYEIHVTDTGIGMSEEFQKKLFDKFEREKNSTTSRIPGTGLGLSISRNIAIALGGSLTFKSKINEGSDFCFRFRAKIAEGNSTENISSVGRDIKKFIGKRILLVEDNELSLEIAKEMLSDYGLIIETANDGSVAVDMVKNSQPGYYDLILMDVQMPYMDGYTATNEIRHLKNRNLASIPIIAMTANAFIEDQHKAYDVGMNAHITKPIDFNKLVNTIYDIIL